jgi:predicted nucleotidyltransferase
MWGQVRATRDADFKVSIGDRSPAEFREVVAKRFPERPTSIPAYLRSPHVIHIWAAPGVAVDFLISIFDYERHAIDRAITATIENVAVRVCTAEDLIVHKAIANREQDWIDIQGVLIRQRGKLDQAYIMKWLREFASELESPEMVTRYRQLRTRYDP